jgi:hypothetical protein
MWIATLTLSFAGWKTSMVMQSGPHQLAGGKEDVNYNEIACNFTNRILFDEINLGM